jgi:hypothetical protein
MRSLLSRIGLALTVIALASSTAAALAQAPGADLVTFRIGFAPYAPFLALPRAGTSSSTFEPKPHHANYAIEGAVVGGVVLGVAGVVVANHMSESSNSSVVLPMLMGAVIGVVVGGLIGSRIPKH